MHKILAGTDKLLSFHLSSLTIHKIVIIFHSFEMNSFVFQNVLIIGERDEKKKKTRGYMGIVYEYNSD